MTDSQMTALDGREIPAGVKNILGLVFGELTVEKYHGVILGRRHWACRCSCPVRSVVLRTARDLLGHRMLSCGCYRKPGPKRTPRHPLYMTWKNMMRRCYDPREIGYKNYGAIGVRVCRRWHEKQNFFDDVVAKPNPRLTIDRFPNKEGDYSPDNFRWATLKEQNGNKRTNVWLDFKGERKIVAEWARITGISESTINHRRLAGWTVEKTLTLRPELYRSRGAA